MRLIDADALSKKLCKTTVFIKGGEIFQRMINEAPTIEPDGDTISRQDAINAIPQTSVDAFENCRNCELLDKEQVVEILERLPSAESTGAMDEAIQKYIEDGYMQPIGEDLISRQAAIDAMWKALYAYEEELEQKFIQDQDVDYADYPVSRMWVQNGHDVCHKAILSLPSAPSTEAETDGDMGEVSDGYHTFNQLYHQRAVLFATIVKQNKEKAWKSWKHGDGKFCFDSNKEWFIVGVDTPEGSYTYHYEKKYWNMFDCVELEHSKFWDGHTEEDVTRLLSLPSAPDSRQRGEWVRLEREENVYDLHGVPTWGVNYMCDKCGFITTAIQDHFAQYKWCPSCGADMRGGEDE